MRIAIEVFALLGYRRSWFWALAHEALAIVLCLWPAVRRLAGTPGFEFAFAQGLLAALSSGHLGVMAAARARECGPAAGPAALVGGTFAAAFAAAVGLLAPPLATVLVAGIWNGQCDYAGGLLFYLVLPVGSALLSSAVGVAAGLAVPRRVWGFVAFLAVALGSLGFSVYRLLSEAPIFAYDPFFGWFPGAIYDELVEVRLPLVAFRIETGIWALATLSAAAALADPRTGRLRLRLHSGPALGVLLAAGLALAGMRYHAADLGYAVSTADVARALGGRLETEHFVIHYPLSSPLARRLEEIALDHEFRYDQLRRYLGVEPAGKVHSFLYADPAQKARLMGARRVSIAKPWLRQLHLHDMGFPHPVLRHELAHVFGGAFGSWFGVSARSPISYNVGLIEGLAVAADWSLGELTGHEWARAARLIQGAGAPRIADLVSATGFWSEGASLAYTLCGSFIRFLIERHGAARFRQAYREGDFERAYGRRLAELASEWERSLESIRLGRAELSAAERRFRRPSIFRRVCGHEAARLEALVGRARGRGDVEAEIRGRRALLALDPANLDRVLALARALLRANRLAEATALVEAEAARRPEAAERLAELRADLHWQAGRLAEARRIYGELLSKGAPTEDARRLAVKVAAIDHPAVGPTVRRLLLDPGSDRPALLERLRELTAAAPAFNVGHYLYGRHLVFARRYAEGAAALRMALRGLPGMDLTVEAKRLLGLATFQLGDYGGAMRIFRDVETSGAPAGIVLDARDWIERIRFVTYRKGTGASGPPPRERVRHLRLTPE